MAFNQWKSKILNLPRSSRGTVDSIRAANEQPVGQPAVPSHVHRDPSRKESRQHNLDDRLSQIRRDTSGKDNRASSDDPPSPIRRDFSRKEGKRAGPGGRPMPPQRIPSVQTRYMDMLLAQDSIPRLHNILASLFQWILLAGYLVLPATFNSINRSQAVQSSSDSGNVAAKAALATVRNVPLLYVGAFCAGIGLIGKAWLWFEHSSNYVWLVNKVFMPGLFNSSAGLISTVVNIYSAQGGNFSVTAKITLCVTGGFTGVFLILFALYNFWALKRVKAKHEQMLKRDIERGSVTGHEHEHEGLMEKVKRKAHEPAAEPSSVI